MSNDDDNTQSFVALTKGTMVSHYRIVEKIGAGGMGEVYLAEDTKLKRQAALKFLPPHLSADPAAQARFTREARAMAALKHPNIATIYEVDEFNGRAYFSMEHVEGRSLRDLIKEGRLELAAVFDLAIQISQGLGKAHQEGVIHRDIKPSNVVIDADGRPKILDFGLAAVRGDEKLTATGSTLGTTRYMSPEQVRGEAIDHRSDLFSLGSLLYELITGRAPFAGERDADELNQILNKTPEPLAHHRSDLSSGLERIVSKALDKNLETRYQHAEDLVADLIREREILLPSGPYAPIATAKSSRWRAPLIITSSVVAVTVLVWLYLVNFRQPASQVVASKKQVTFAGDIGYSEISPDGSLITYTRGGGQHPTQVFVQDLSGGKPLQVFEDRIVYGLHWSPDGSELLVAARNDSVRGIYTVPRLGGTPRRYPFHTYPNSYYSWAPDGQGFVGHVPQQKRKLIFVDKKSGDMSSFVVDGPFDWISYLSWSPDGEHFLFSGISEGMRTIWVMRADGTGLKPVYEGSAISPRWAPDGEAIYFLQSRQQVRDLMKLPLDLGSDTPGGEPKVLLSGLRGGLMSLSADGKKLLHREAISWSNLWRLDLTDTGQNQQPEATQLTFTTHDVGWPAISPDEKWVTFNGPVDEYWQIFKMPIEGGEPIQLSFLARSCRSPSWSPDGRSIVFVSQDEESHQITTIGADGGGVRLFDSTKTSGDVKWFSNSIAIYRRPGNRNYHFLNLDTETEWPLVTNDSVGWMFYASPAPDGHRVAIQWNYQPGRGWGDATDSVGIWVIDTRDSSHTFLAQKAGRPIGWSEDGAWIYAIMTVDHLITRVNALNGEFDTLVITPFDNLGRAAVTPDGQTVVCDVAEQQSDLWLIENFDPDIE